MMAGDPELRGQIEEMIKNDKVNAEYATEQVANMMVTGGVRAIWNFAPATLNLPDNVLVKNENLAASFAAISAALRRRH